MTPREPCLPDAALAALLAVPVAVGVALALAVG
jgi:hypothetical protein